MISSLDNTRLAEITGVSKKHNVGISTTQAAQMQYHIFTTIINYWLSGDFSLPPTWRSLYEVLEELGLMELSQRIQEYLIRECTVC